MRNIGTLKSTSLVTKQFGNVITTSINIASEYRNLHYEISLYSSVFKNPLILSLIFNYQNLFINNGLGKGIQFNYYLKVSYTIDALSLILENAEGVSFVFSFEREDSEGTYVIDYYKNDEMHSTITVYNGVSGFIMSLHTKDGKVITFTPIGNDFYASKIRTRNGDEITITYDSNARITRITNNAYKMEKIDVTYNSQNVDIICYKTNNNNVLVEKGHVVLNYNQNGYITRITTYNTHTSIVPIKDISFSYYINGSGLQIYTIKNELNNLQIEWKINAYGYVMYYKDELGREENFDYQYGDFTTKIIDYLGHETILYDNKNGDRICYRSLFKEMVQYNQYDNINQLEISSNKMYYNPSLNGKLVDINPTITQISYMSVSAGTLPTFLTSYYLPNRCIRLSSSLTAGSKYRLSYLINGNKGEIYSFGIWLKINSYGNADSKVKISMRITGNEGDATTKKSFSKDIIVDVIESTDEYKYYMTSIYAEENFAYLIVDYEFLDNMSSIDTIYDLYDGCMAKLYEYDDRGNEIIVLDGNNLSHNVYNNSNKITFSNGIYYQYDYYGNLIREGSLTGIVTKYQYDEYHNLISQERIKDNQVIKSTQSYINREFVSSKNDENNNDEYYTYSNDFKLTNAYNSVYETAFDYIPANSDKLLRETHYNSNDEIIGKVEYDYRNDYSLDEIETGNNVKYKISYDSYSRDVGLKISNITHITKTYLKKNNKETYIINSIKVGNAQKIINEYDSYDRILLTKYKETELSNEKILFSYVYNDDDSISTISDSLTNTSYAFSYDDNKFPVSYSYSYDNDSNYSYVDENILNGKGAFSFHMCSVDSLSFIDISFSMGKLLDNDFNYYKGVIRNTNNHFLCMFDEFMTDLYNNENTIVDFVQRILLINYNSNDAIPCYNEENLISNCSKDGYLTYYQFGDSIVFNVDNLDTFTTVMGIYFATTGYFYRCNTIRLKLNSNCKIEVYYQSQLINTIDEILILNNWHFIAFSFNKNDNTINVLINGTNHTINVGYSLISQTYIKFGDSISGKITNIILNKAEIIDENTLNNYYMSFRYILALNIAMNDQNGDCAYKSNRKVIHNINYGIIPLENGTTGVWNGNTINATIDTILDIQCIENKNSEFIYNDLAESYAYFAFGQQLTYNLDLNSPSTISIEVNRMFIDENNTIFDIVDNNGIHILLYLVGGIAYLKVGNAVFQSQYNIRIMDINKWHRFTLSFSKQSSLPLIFYNFRVFFDDVLIISGTIRFINDFNSITLNVGTTSQKTDPFNGLMKELIFDNVSTTSDNISAFLNNLPSNIQFINVYGKFNLVDTYRIVDDFNEVFSISYNYKTINIDDNRVRNLLLISEETITTNTLTKIYSYEYDDLNNVTKISSGNDIIAEYEYDAVGRLTKDDYGNYVYDDNGNIQEVLDDSNNLIHSYIYDNNFKDLLIQFDNDVITYDSNNTFNPVSIGNNITLQYRIKNLIEYNNTSTGIHNKYYYDHNGNRVKKEIINSQGLISSITWYYYNSNGQLIYQSNNTIKLLFIYDNNNEIKGFEYNNTKYYYVKNILGVIIYIVNSNGNILVEYEYDAWGNIVSTTDISAINLANINPIRYKEYYYDNDIEMYYCKSRYYVPKWRRWLNADSSDYLDYSNFSTLNLFAYCCNNPVMLIDKTGTDAYVVIDYTSETGLKIVGHARLYYEDADGVWWMTEVYADHLIPKTQNVKIGSRREVLSKISGFEYYPYICDTSSIYPIANLLDGNIFPYEFLKCNCLTYVNTLLKLTGIITFWSNPLDFLPYDIPMFYRFSDSMMPTDFGAIGLKVLLDIFRFSYTSGTKSYIGKWYNYSKVTLSRGGGLYTNYSYTDYSPGIINFFK